MTKELINPGSHYQSNRAYSKGVKVDIGDSEMLFISGQIAKDEDGRIVGKGNYSKQTEYIFEKIITILKEADMTIDDVVKLNIYVTDMSQFEEVSSIRNKYLKKSRPASTAIAMGGTVTTGCNVEIDVIAVKKRSNEDISSLKFKERIKEIIKDCRKFYELSEDEFVAEPVVSLIYTREEMDEVQSKKTADWVRATTNSRGIYIIDESVVEKITPHKKGEIWITLRHEINHWYYNHITKSYKGCPRWFTEGLADYYAGRRAQKPEKYEGSELDKSFSEYTPLTYKIGYPLVEKMFERFGRKKIIIFIKEFGKAEKTSENFNSIFKKHFKISPYELEEEVKKELFR